MIKLKTLLKEAEEKIFVNGDGYEVYVRIDNQGNVVDAYVDKDSPLVFLKDISSLESYLGQYLRPDDWRAGYNWKWKAGQNPLYVHIGKNVRNKNAFLTWIEGLGFIDLEER